MSRLGLSFYLFIVLITAAQGRPYYFRHYNIDDGLPNNTVYDCIQDRKGFLWFATKEGLARFDGYQFKVFLHNSLDTNSLLNNYVLSIKEDKDGWIWIGTTEGLCYYLPDNDYFGSVLAGNQKISRMVYSIEADNSNNIWIATLAGLYRYNKTDRKLSYYSPVRYFVSRKITVTNTGDTYFAGPYGKIYKYNPENDNFITYNILTEKEISASTSIADIVDAGDHGLIISTNNSGLRQFEPGSGKVTSLFKNDTLWNKIQIRTTFMFSPDELWIGSESGIYIYNLKSGYVTNLRMINTDPFSISNNAVRRIYKDKEGGVWVCTFYGGVSYLPHENKLFIKYYPTELPGSLNGNIVTEIQSDQNNNIWIGTEDAGLVRYDTKTGKFSNIKTGQNHVKINSNNVQALLIDGNDLWIGTYDEGIYVMDIPTLYIRHHFKSNDGKSGLKTNSFITFLKTGDGIIFAGSIHGIYQYDKESASFKYFDDVAVGTFVYALLEDNNKNIWIGTYGRGLYKYNRMSGLCQKVLSEKGDYEKLRNEYITSLFQDNNNRIWFTTEGNGFSYIDSDTEEIVRFIPGKDIEFSIYCSVLQDDVGKMWIASTRGLLRFDPSSKKYVTYTKSDGLLENTFSYNSAYKDKNGRMYFGTLKGMISFCPDNIRENTYNPPVYITGLQINGKEYFINKTGSPEYESSLVTKSITLKNNQSTLSIDFVSPTFTSPALTKYKYIMEGVDHDWIFISGNRKVYYTNLAPGKYKFRVQASPDGETWDTHESSLDIRIKPHLLLSGFALGIYTIILISVVYLLIATYFKKKALEQQRTIDLLERKKEKEILNAKINFFTNITHEIRSPLTLIKGPLDRILKTGVKNTKETEENLQIIKKNTDRLLNLINQLLDFRKTEKDMLRLNFIKSDLLELISSTINLYLPYGAEKMISLQLHSPVKHFVMAFDKEAVTKILSNLISNAIKFAKSKVDIYLETEPEKNSVVRIRVNNDGIHIPYELSEKIFEPFYQIDSRPGEKGTGLGLSLARSLAELHRGKLYLDTSVTRYNSFVLELPKYQEEVVESCVEPVEKQKINTNKFEVYGSSDSTLPTILLVEDEIEIGRFLAKELSEIYNVVLTFNGDEALKALHRHNITVVITDVIMPSINGYELCRQIKSNVEFSHIPVILLTASIHLNARIEGLDSGADAYIEKPFSTDLLLAQIANLIKNRNKHRQYFVSTPLANYNTIAMNKTDEEFLKELDSILMENISENDLSVDKIAELMKVSTSTLYRKVKALTDLNTVEYIRFARLKKAAELLSEGNYRINEISYLVGFSSPSYFATSFQKQFGISPSQFVKELNGKSVNKASKNSSITDNKDNNGND